MHTLTNFPDQQSEHELRVEFIVYDTTKSLAYSFGVHILQLK